jgi:hypothetical protein
MSGGKTLERTKKGRPIRAASRKTWRQVQGVGYLRASQKVLVSPQLLVPQVSFAQQPAGEQQAESWPQQAEAGAGQAAVAAQALAGVFAARRDCQ